MSIPKITDEHLKQAFRYIDENGIPDQNRSIKYELVLDNGKKYPPKYVIAVAAKLATGEDIKTDIKEIVLSAHTTLA